VHVGTLVSIAIVFWPSLTELTRGILRQAWQWAAAGGRSTRELLYLRLGLLCTASVGVTAIIGFTLKSAFERVFAAPVLVAGTLTLTGLLLWWTDRLGRRTRSLRRLNLPIAAAIGAAQGLALIPGLSRSGMTIVAGLFSGLKRRWAAEYSFFLAIPTILAATAVQALEVELNAGLGEITAGVLLAGFVVAALVGVVSLRLVLFFLYRARLKVFSFYLWLLAAVVALGFLDPTVL